MPEATITISIAYKVYIEPVMAESELSVYVV